MHNLHNHVQKPQDEEQELNDDMECLISAARGRAGHACPQILQLRIKTILARRRSLEQVCSPKGGAGRTHTQL